MSKRITLLTLAAGLMLPLAAGSAPLSYNYIDLLYANDNLDRTTAPKGVDGDGWQIDGSIAFDDNLYGAARYSETKLNKGTGDYKRTTVGIGYMTKVGEAASAYGQVSYESYEIEKVDNGFSAEAGLRYGFNDAMEVSGAVEYIDLTDSKKKFFTDLESEVGLKIGGQYHFTPALAAVAGYEYLSKYDNWRIGLRWNYGS